jgi:hypothetical protein
VVGEIQELARKYAHKAINELARLAILRQAVRRRRAKAKLNRPKSDRPARFKLTDCAIVSFFVLSG